MQLGPKKLDNYIEGDSKPLKYSFESRSGGSNMTGLSPAEYSRRSNFLTSKGYWIGKNPRQDVVDNLYDFDVLKMIDSKTWNKIGRADRPFEDQRVNLIVKSKLVDELLRHNVLKKEGKLTPSQLTPAHSPSIKFDILIIREKGGARLIST